MISSNDVYFSSTTIGNDLPSPSPNRYNSVAPSDFLDDLLMEFNLGDPDNTDILPLDNNEIDGLLNGQIEGFDEAQAVIFDGELPNSLDQSTLSSEDSTTNNQNKATDTTRTNSAVVKTSDLHAHSNFINNTWLYETGGSLKLHTSPYPCQRARYERELKQDLRYISTPGNNCIDFERIELRSRMSVNTSVIMRVCRTTIPYGPDEIVFCHPYPLWVKDEHAKVHHGSLLIDITDQIMNNETINVLHFQIFLVDENQVAYPTDLLCETTPILEYEDKDRKSLSVFSASERKRQTKRLQQKSNTVT
ncbi:unnamed protein product [Rotaria sp. Silwood1]|nr:unnamed protein product [Rotaria sp. Silwood1]CAF4964289.1 unnamed protein product [Rotaria sp. Silwood1]